MIGYLIVRGGVHQEAYAKALSDLSGADVTKLLPVPEIRSDKFPHARKFMDKGFHRILYRFSPDDYRQIGEIWNGLQADTGSGARGRGRPPRGRRGPRPQPGPAAVRPGRERRGHRRDRQAPVRTSRSRPASWYLAAPARRSIPRGEMEE